MTELHDDRKKLAKVLGMKLSEVVAAAEVPDADPPAVVVETHDGQRVLLIDAGEAAPVVAPWDGLMPTGEVLDVTYTDEPTEGDADEGDQGDDNPPAVGDDDTEEVPAGSADEVLTWVGQDAKRAERALVAEQDAAKPRSTLVAALKKLAGQA